MYSCRCQTISGFGLSTIKSNVKTLYSRPMCVSHAARSTFPRTHDTESYQLG